jgi:Ca2+-binding RTX toxin-like protein
VSDSFISGEGDDELYGDYTLEVSDDILQSGDGNDYIVAGSGNDTAYGDAGNDFIIGSAQENDFTDGTDILYGGSGDDTFIGGYGNDLLIGDEGDDTFNGSALSNVGITGVGEIDTLQGGAGEDIFYLGTSDDHPFYDDGNNQTPGLGDYAVISDFNAAEGDMILLNGNNYLGTTYSYILGAAPASTGLTGTGIYIDNDGVAGLSSNDELIAVLSGVFLSGTITDNTPGFNVFNVP